MPQPDFQKIRAPGFDPSDLDLDPQTIQKHWLSSIWIRTVSFLFGLSKGRAVHIAATEQGAVKVADLGSAFTIYETKTATTTNDPTANEFKPTVGVSNRWDILVETNDVKIRFFKPDGVTFYPDIPLVIGYYSIPFSSLGLQFDSRVDDSHGVYHVSAFA